MRLEKLLFVVLTAALAIGVIGCKYDDEDVWSAINAQEQRIVALEKLQQTTNSNIAALQAIVDGNDFVKSVTPITVEGQIVGYTISFLRQGDIAIYNGEKGETGEKGDKGDQGNMPVIGVEKLTNDAWYWTLNGELLKNADGEPICASGNDGKDGSNGENAPTPELKYGSTLGSGYVNDAVYLSVDGGKTWVKVSGDNGKDGNPGYVVSGGPNIFSKSPEDMGSYWLFTLANGTGIKVAKYDLLMLSSVVNGKEATIAGGELKLPANLGFSIKYKIADKNTKVTVKVNGSQSFSETDGTVNFEGLAEGDELKVIFVTVDINNRTNFYTVIVSVGEKNNEEPEQPVLPENPNNSKKMLLTYVECTRNDHDNHEEGDKIELFYNSSGQYEYGIGPLHFGWTDWNYFEYFPDKIYMPGEGGKEVSTIENGLIIGYKPIYSSSFKYHLNYDSSRHLTSMGWYSNINAQLYWNGDIIESAIDDVGDKVEFDYESDSQMNISAIIRLNAYLICKIVEDEYPDIFAQLGYLGVVPEKPITVIGQNYITYGALDQNYCPTSFTITEVSEYYTKSKSYVLKWTESK